ncbi:MAG TPA: A24 family peptidase [Chloroflexota bacterium]|nr:A24 family peptidase [Chloroflexota bacterium]
MGQRFLQVGRRRAGREGVRLGSTWLLVLLSALVVGAFLWRFGPSPKGLIYATYALILLTMLVIDYRHRWVYPALCGPGTALGMALAPVATGSAGSGVLGALAAGGVGLFFYELGRLGYRGQEPLGRGDVLLAAQIGALVGWERVGAALLTGALLMAAVAAVLLVTRRRRAGDYLPYGAGLCAGALVALLGYDVP